ncbi:hypothetical protein EH165_07210 [Nakamurella antarctica]|uniref:Uncharacterized protein n=1 Tax=Nakamurella antarctica TaxID=1902245 RepID=A0A3G8ZWC3_9ACTN|nr:hypothetical protein [Nakamurella antarctica]AZI57961.1 hypothetical protein EH165_07210 [Nakamurella antarctica]
MAGVVRNPLIAATSYLTRSSLSFAADLASAWVKLGESAVGAVTGTRAGPATLRLNMLILCDENGAPLIAPGKLTASINRASNVLLDESGVRVRHVGTRVSGRPAPTAALDPRANKLLLLDELTGRNDFYRSELADFSEAGSLLDVVGKPITAIVVRNIAGQTTGCSLGISADWVIVQASLFDDEAPHSYDETVLAHELGHACNLPHHPDKDNLMFPMSSPPADIRGTSMNKLQSAVLHGNRHVIPGVRH